MKSLALTDATATREALLALCQEIPGARTGVKIAALLLVLDGQHRGWIAEVLGLTRMTLTSWIHAVNQGGIASLKAKRRAGRPSQLTASVRSEILEHLEKMPEEFGISSPRWNGTALVKHLRRHFHIEIKVRQAQYWMQKLGHHGNGLDLGSPNTSKKDSSSSVARPDRTPNS
jgi:transposase